MRNRKCRYCDFHFLCLPILWSEASNELHIARQDGSISTLELSIFKKWNYDGKILTLSKIVQEPKMKMNLSSWYDYDFIQEMEQNESIVSHESQSKFFY